MAQNDHPKLTYVQQKCLLTGPFLFRFISQMLAFDQWLLKGKHISTLDRKADKCIKPIHRILLFRQETNFLFQHDLVNSKPDLILPGNFSNGCLMV